jgi:hypothetical protein
MFKATILLQNGRYTVFISSTDCRYLTLTLLMSRPKLGKMQNCESGFGSSISSESRSGSNPDRDPDPDPQHCHWKNKNIVKINKIKTFAQVNDEIGADELVRRLKQLAHTFQVPYLSSDDTVQFCCDEILILVTWRDESIPPVRSVADTSRHHHGRTLSWL